MNTAAQPRGRIADDLSGRKARSLWGDAWRRLRRNHAAVPSIVVIGFFTLVAIFAPLLAPHNPIIQTSNNSMRFPVWVQIDNPALRGRPEYLFGTDLLGRDVLSQLIYGTRVSLIVGLVPTAMVLAIGTGIGLVAGFAGGHIDALLMRFTDIMYAFPGLLLIITLATAMRDTWLGQALSGLLLIFFALVIVGWTDLARLVRGQVLSLKQKEFVEAARAVGVPAWKILLRHILPNILAPVIVWCTFGIPGAILSEAGLTFLGAGLRPSLDLNNPFPTSWGVMLADGYANVTSNLWMVLFPMTCLAALTVAFTFLGDGLRDALDPYEQL
jgi:oligopeptide transport system permease protein